MMLTAVLTLAPEGGVGQPIITGNVLPWSTMKHILTAIALCAPIFVYGQQSLPMPRTPNATSGSMPSTDNPILRGSVRPIGPGTKPTTGSMPTTATAPRASMPTSDIRPANPQPTNITGRWTDGVPAPAPRRGETVAMEDEESVPDVWTAAICSLGLLRDRVICLLSGF